VFAFVSHSALFDTQPNSVIVVPKLSFVLYSTKFGTKSDKFSLELNIFI
jgi:hypothetical protein